MSSLVIRFFFHYLFVMRSSYSDNSDVVLLLSFFMLFVFFSTNINRIKKYMFVCLRLYFYFKCKRIFYRLNKKSETIYRQMYESSRNKNRYLIKLNSYRRSIKSKSQDMMNNLVFSNLFISLTNVRLSF